MGRRPHLAVSAEPRARSSHSIFSHWGPRRLRQGLAQPVSRCPCGAPTGRGQWPQAQCGAGHGWGRLINQHPALERLLSQGQSGPGGTREVTERAQGAWESCRSQGGHPPRRQGMQEELGEPQVPRASAGMWPRASPGWEPALHPAPPPHGESSSLFLGKLPTSRLPAHLGGPYTELGRGSGTPRWSRNSCVFIYLLEKNMILTCCHFSQGRRSKVGTARCRTPGASLRSSCRGRRALTCCGSSRRWGSSMLRCVVERGVHRC